MKVTVIGAAGWVGSAAAFRIGTLQLADEIVLLGRRQNYVEQHAIDMSTALAPLGVSVRAGAYTDLGGSDVVICAAGKHQSVLWERTEVFADNVRLAAEVAREVRDRCPEAVLIMATNPIDVMNYAAWKAAGRNADTNRASAGAAGAPEQSGTPEQTGAPSGLERSRFVGYSLNDSLRFREFIAAVKGVRVDQVDGLVVGEHGATQVLLFSSARIDGEPVSFTEAEKEAIRLERPKYFERNEALQTGRSAGWTCGMGLADMTRAIIQDTGEVFPASAILQGEYGHQDVSIGMPVCLGRSGVREVLQWELAADEKAELDHSVSALRPIFAEVDQILAAS